VQDATGTPYISAALTTLDMGAAFQKQSKIEQTVDTHGNLTQYKIYNYGNLTTPARTYTNTYLTGAAYTARNIWDRLVSSSVNGVTLVTTYDTGTLVDRTGLSAHDTANYGPGMTTRGNMTSRVTPGRTVNVGYDITGTVVSSNDGQGHSASYEPDENRGYAVIKRITANGLTDNYTHNTWLGLTSATGPNSESVTVGYDGVMRPTSSTSPHGAVTTYQVQHQPALQGCHDQWEVGDYQCKRLVNHPSGGGRSDSMLEE